MPGRPQKSSVGCMRASTLDCGTLPRCHHHGGSSLSVFSVPVEVSDLERRRSERVDAWVDTGAFYSSLPRPILESLGIAPHDRAQFMLADGRILDNDIGYMRMRIGDKSVITLVIFAELESEPLLGAYALAGLALAVDSLNELLVPRPRLPLFECARIIDP